MKTALTKHKETRTREFPFLAQSIHENPADSFTVLFVGPQSGTVVHCGPSGAWKVGAFYQVFTSVFRAEHWRILPPNEVVTIQND